MLRDRQDSHVDDDVEVCRDEAALEAYRAAPDTLDGPTEAIRRDSVFPAAMA